MKFTFNHPVLAGGVHTGTGAPRTCVGTVETPIEIEELSSSELDPAFSFPDRDHHVHRRGGMLYHPAPHSVETLLGGDLRTMTLMLEDNGYQMMGYPERFSKAARAVQTRGDALLPLARGWASAAIDMGTRETVMEWASKTGPIAARRVVSLDEADIEGWREKARLFFRNFLIVGGRTMTRCHEPLFQATGPGVFLQDFSFFRSHVDYSTNNYLGFPSGRATWDTRLHPFPADMRDEAVEYCRRNGWMDDGFGHGVVVHDGCATYSEILDEELVRHAGLHATLGDILESQADDNRLSGRFPAHANALSDLKSAALAYLEGGSPIEALETAMSKLLEVRAETPVEYALLQGYERTRAMQGDTGLLLARRDDAPITAPMMTMRP